MKQWLGYAGLLIRLVVGAGWIAAGAATLTDPTASAFTVRAYQLLPGGVADQVGYLLPPLEVVIGLALVVGLLTRGAALVSTVLLTVYTFAISWAWAKGLDADCGCFGGGGALLTHAQAVAKDERDIAHDVVLAALSAFLVRLPRTRLSLDALLVRRGRPDRVEPVGPQTQGGDRVDGAEPVEA